MPWEDGKHLKTYIEIYLNLIDSLCFGSQISLKVLYHLRRFWQPVQLFVGKAKSFLRLIYFTATSDCEVTTCVTTKQNERPFFMTKWIEIKILFFSIQKHIDHNGTDFNDALLCEYPNSFLSWLVGVEGGYEEGNINGECFILFFIWRNSVFSSFLFG